MTLLDLLNTPADYIICVAQLVLWVASIELCLFAIYDRRHIAVIALCAGLFAVEFFVITVLLDSFYRGNWYHNSPQLHLVEWLYGLPWWVVVLSVGLEAVLVGVCMLGHVRFARHRLTPLSIKEGVDMLPVGICFGDGKGTLSMANLCINQYCVRMGCAPLVDVEKFWQQIVAAAIWGQEDKQLVTLQDSAVMFRSCFVTVDGVRYRQITATDITRQYCVTLELQSKNDKLRDIQMRIKLADYQLADLVRAKELLDARVTVHDEIGHLLLRGKYYLDHGGDDDEMLAMLRDVNLSMLAQADDSVQHSDEYAEAVHLAQVIGVVVETQGEVPTGPVVRAILARAVRECATNAVKHAQGDHLQVTIDANARNWIVTITNNGTPPAGPVVPTGGLQSLDRNVEALGGTTLVHSSPVFALTMVLPKNE